MFANMILPTSNIQDEIKRINKLLPKEILEIRENFAHIQGNKLMLHRVFLACQAIGFIAPKEINQCMICTSQFNNRKLHCSCCGNVICSKCCDTFKTGLVCCQCSYGQDVQNPLPNAEGLPVFIDQVGSYGMLRISCVKSTKVLRCWLDNKGAKGFADFQRGLINVCLSDDVPSTDPNAQFIYMSLGPRFESVDGIMIFHVIINSNELSQRETNNTQNELYQQIIAFISRVSDKLLRNVDVFDFLPYYHPQLTIQQNNNIADNVKNNFNDFGSNQAKLALDLKVVLPSEEVFKELIQVPLSPDESSAILRLQRTSILPLTRVNLNLLTEQEIYYLPSDDEVSSVTVTEDFQVQLFPTSYPKLREKFVKDNSKVTDTSIDSTVRIIHNPYTKDFVSIRKEIFTDKMESFLEPFEHDFICENSAEKPSILVGWLIECTDKKTDRYVVTGVRKNLSRKTEFCLSSFKGNDQWTRLKRGKKDGQSFRLILNIFLSKDDY